MIPNQPFDISLPNYKCLTANNESGLSRFISTHAKAYGQEFNEKDTSYYKQDIESGIFHPNNSTTFFINDVPIGCISFSIHKTPENEDCILISDLGVPKDQQNKGYGKEIIKHLLNDLSKRFSSETIVLADIEDTNKISIKTFKKIGFIETEWQNWFPS